MGVGWVGLVGWLFGWLVGRSSTYMYVYMRTGGDHLERCLFIHPKLALFN